MYVCIYIHTYQHISLYIYLYLYLDPRYGLRSSGRWSHCKGLYVMMIYVCICIYIYTSTYTSSTAQGGGGSFNNRKPKGELGCCESGMAERSHWWIDRRLISLTLSLSFSLFLSLSLTINLPTYLPTYLPIYLSTYLPIDRSIYLYSFFTLDNIKNERILRDFLQKWKVDCSADGLVPIRFAIFPFHVSKVPRLPEKVMPGHTECCTCHAKSS